MTGLTETDVHPTSICRTTKSVLGAIWVAWVQTGCLATRKPPAVDHGTHVDPCLERRKDTKQTFAVPCRAEAQALLQCDCTAEEAALRLGPHCDIVVVTDGANGSCISAMGRLQARPSRLAVPTLISDC